MGLVSKGQITINDLNDGAYAYTATVYAQQFGTPDTPTGGSFDFSTKTLTVPTDPNPSTNPSTGATIWSGSIPTSSTTPTYASSFLFFTTPPDTVATGGTWSTPVSFVVNGTNAISVQLSNDTVNIPADSDGNVASGTPYNGSGTIVRVYEGATLLNYNGVGTTNGTWAVSAVGTNITASVTKTTLGTVPFQYVSYGDHSLITADVATVTYTVTGTSSTGVSFSLTKTQSLTKQKQGDPTVTSDLTNGNHTIPTDSSGNNGNFTGCTTTMSVFIGSVDDSINWTYAVTKSAGVTCTEVITSRTQTVTAMTTDTGTVTIVASKAGFASQTQVFSISKAKSGVTYQINLSNNSVRKSSTPTSLTLTASKIDVSGVTAYTGRFKIYLNGSAIATYTSAADEASKAYTVTATDATIKCELYLAGGTTTLVDTETVLVVADGADGADGVDGTNGTSVYTGTIYKQITTATAPSGGTYNFSTGILTAPDATWSAIPPTTTTTPTWACDYNFSTTTPATSVTAGTWTNLHIDMVKGSDGINGTRTAVLDLYQWSSSVPTLFPSGTSTYTWATGQFTNPATLNSWTQTPASPTAGQVLYVCHATFADSLATATSTVTWNTTVALTSGSAGSNGDAGQRIGFLELYRWSAAAPTTYPSGTSTYTWSTGTFTAPATLNSWALVPATAVAGQSLWGISATISNTSTTATDTVTWSSTAPYVVGYAGGNGTSINVVELYQQAASPPPLPTGTSYDFSTDTLSGTLGSWVRTMPASSTTPTYMTVCTFTVTAPTTSQSRTSWSAAVIAAQNGSNGSPGGTGQSARRAYIVTTSASPPATPTAGSGDVAPTGWSFTATATLTTGQFMYQSDGLYTSGGNITWGVPYLSNLKVGSLSAITADLGTITSGAMTIGTGRTFNGKALEIYASGLVQVDNITGGFISGSNGVLSNGWAMPAISAASENLTSGGDALNGVVAASNSNLNSHGIRGKNANKNTGGLIGAANGYDFYADGGGTNYGPFTGAHDALILNENVGILEIGDIVIDDILITKKNISNSLFTIQSSSVPYQKGVVGVVSGITGILNGYKPASLIDAHYENSFYGLDFVRYSIQIQDMIPLYYEIRDLYTLLSMNALGEGQINVCGENGDIERGDFIVSSSIAGKGMKQSDDLYHNYTVAKSRESITFSSPTEIKQIACIYLCG